MMTVEKELPRSSRRAAREAPLPRRTAAAQARVICTRADRGSHARGVGGGRRGVEEAVMEYLRDRRRMVS